MMNFITMTASITVAILLAVVVVYAVLLQPKVMNWLMKRAEKVSQSMLEEVFKDEEGRA